MRIFELQNDIKEQLEADVHLMKTCAVVCADALDAVNEIERALAKTDAILLLVGAPEIERDGCAQRGIPCRVTIRVDAIEVPAMRHLRSADAAIATAADAAQRVAFLLDGPRYNFASLRQTADTASATLTATATFNTYLQLCMNDEL